jgi:predicted NAD-dependent protein-ADP-ribosyltransferase YbiA (DUF1768 family)
MVINIDFRKSYPANVLSNLYPNTFRFRGETMASMEALLQSLKFANIDAQRSLWKRSGFQAKFAGKGEPWWEKQTLYWKGEEIPRHSEEYQSLLTEAYYELFEQNEKAREALISTGNEKITHTVGTTDPNRTILTRNEFCARLTVIRDVFRTSDFISL